MSANISTLLIMSFLLAQCINLHAYELHILHTNDVHAHVEEFNRSGKICDPEDRVAGTCYGGVSRRYTAIEDVTKLVSNVILVDAGDFTTGTKWSQVFRGDATAYFMNRLNYTAMVGGDIYLQ
ncbi:snake venom 5'-nucleotidase-like [Saccoglossus kowalevskii]